MIFSIFSSLALAEETPNETGDIEGIVRWIDEVYSDGEEFPVKGAEVNVDTVITTTNEDGEFVLGPLDEGSVEISFEHENFTTKTKEVEVIAGETKNIGIVHLEEDVESVVIESVSPEEIENTEEKVIDIIGEGFLSETEVYLDGSNEGINAYYYHDNKIRVTIVSGYPEGVYDIELVNPDGTDDILANGFKVVEPDVTEKDKPVIDSVDPDTIGYDNSSLILIKGSNFNNVEIIVIDSEEFTNFDIMDSSNIALTIPSKFPEGKHDVKVIDKNNKDTLRNGIVIEKSEDASDDKDDDKDDDSDKDEGDDDEEKLEDYEFFVDHDGKNISDERGKIEINIGPHTTYFDAIVELREISREDTPSPLEYKQITETYKFEITEKTSSKDFPLLKPVKVSFPYVGPEEPRLYRWKNDEEKWVAQFSYVEDNKVKGEIKENGYYAVFIDEDVVLLNDLSGFWAEREIDMLVRRGVVKGYEDYTFRPDNPVTRAEFVVFLDRILNWELLADSFDDFKDMSTVGEWAWNSIGKAVSNDVLRGYPDKTIRPNNHINYQEAEWLMQRAVNDKTIDLHEILSEAMKKEGVVIGQYGGEGNITRAETAYVLAKINQ